LDKDRVDAFNQAIKMAISKAFKSHKNRKITVLDVESSTGLLCMMAARAGADYVVGCEAAQHMADLSTGIVYLNGFEGVVKILPKELTQLQVCEPPA
jgi:23S rRNA G2069 N7-methylase RlmK/C1962 C5-methylase RlmI